MTYELTYSNDPEIFNQHMIFVGESVTDVCDQLAQTFKGYSVISGDDQISVMDTLSFGSFATYQKRLDL